MSIPRAQHSVAVALISVLLESVPRTKGKKEVEPRSRPCAAPHTPSSPCASEGMETTDEASSD